MEKINDYEIDSLYEEFEAVMIRKFPPEEYGEDEDYDVLMHIAEQLRGASKGKKQFINELLKYYSDNFDEQQVNDLRHVIDMLK